MQAQNLIRQIKVMEEEHITPAQNIVLLALYTCGNYTGNEKLASVVGESVAYVNLVIRILHKNGYVDQIHNTLTQKAEDYLNKLIL